jgi:glycosyltransferase involved in cell wall biosynthesis
MRILFLSPSGSLGGAERVLLEWVDAVRAERSAATVSVLSFDDGPLVNALKCHGVAVSVLPLPESLRSIGDTGCRGALLGSVRLMVRGLTAVPAFRGYVTRLREAIASVRPDLVHSNGIKSHLLAWHAIPAGVPTVWHVHDFYGARSFARPLLARASRSVARAVAVSQAVADDFVASGGRCPVTTVANAIDTERFRPRCSDGSSLDALAGMPTANVLRVGLVATYARWKGHDVFLSAAAQLVRRRDGANLRFFVIGGPIYRTDRSQFEVGELRALVHRLGLTERVGFIDFQPDIEEMYPALDIVVHASTRPEPFGLTVVEAMACGCPVVAANAGGTREIVTEGVDALAVPPGDASSLAEAIARLASDAAFRERLGRAARLTATTRFDRSRLGRQIVNVYDELLGDRRVVTRQATRSAITSNIQHVEMTS